MEVSDYTAETRLQRIQKERCWVPWEIGCIVQKRKEMKHLRLAAQGTGTEEKSRN